MNGLASVARAYEEAEGKDVYDRRSRIVGDDWEQEDDITFLTLRRSDVS